MFSQNRISKMPFKTWLFKDNENRRLHFLSLIITVISFTWLKIIYPFPNFMPPDSNSYIEAAQTNQFINIWAIGYSKFLRFVSSFSNSHFVLVLLQYLLLQASVLYLLFTMRYLFSLHKWAFRCLFIISISNPLLVHICNFVASDALFTTLSIVWFTQLLWIIYQPNKNLIIAHAFVLLLAFMVRYNALFYPFVSISIICSSHLPKIQKLTGIGFTLFLLFFFVGATQYEYDKKTHTLQFSAFGSWQMAANALYGYAHATPITPEKVPVQFKGLHELVNHHMDSLRRQSIRPDEEVGVYYLWDFKSPLRLYMDFSWRNDTTTKYLKKWASMGPLYAAYGSYLIKSRPFEFIKYYLWPNAIKYYAPPTKFMGIYNMGNEKVTPIVANWFGWKNNKLHTYSKHKGIKITEAFPIIFSIINIAFLLGFIAYALLGGFNNTSSYIKKILWWTITIWLTNMFFSIFAAPIELRYQLFPMVITFCFMFSLLAYIIDQSFKTPSELIVNKQYASLSEPTT